MAKAIILFLLAAAYFLLQSVSVLAEEGSATQPDVRVLIDISGSMKQNDPHNLRVPALNMLIGLLPEDAKAGVWTFAEKVNMLVPHARVDGQWKNMARLQSSRINSVGLFTNIGGALEAAAFGSAQQAAGYHRSIILLTDGMVDIDRDPQVNLAERTRLLEQILPAIMDTQIAVHSIALSKKSDIEAMQRLSLSTGGIFAVAESADDLARIFLQAFDRAVPSEQVPLLDNQFLIDSSIEEFTLLAFRKADSDATTLKSPAGATFRVTDYPRHVKWFAGRGFDLVTVRQPLEGEWILYADQAPQNRVTIISNLKLMVNKLPVNTYPGVELELAVHFQEDGKVIVDPDILKLLDIQIVVTFPDGTKKAKTISRGTAIPAAAIPGAAIPAAAIPAAAIPAAAIPADGVFRTPLKIFRERGKYNVLVSVDGKTFAREKFQDVFLRDPVTVEVLEEIAVVRIKPISQLIDVSATAVLAKLRKPDGKSVIRPLSLQEGGYWDLDLSPFTEPGQYQLYLDVEGRTLSGQLFNLTLDPLTIQYPPSQLAVNEPGEESASPEPPQASEVASESLTEQAPSVAAIDAESSPQQPDKEIAAPERESVPVAERDGWDGLPADPALVQSILFGTLVLFGSLALFALGYWYYRKKLPVAQISAELPDAGEEQVSAERSGDPAREEFADAAEAVGGEEETVLRETPEPVEDADESVHENALENGDAEDLESAVGLDEEAPDDDSAADEQDLDEFLDGITSDLEEKTLVAQNAASDSDQAEPKGDPAVSDGEQEPPNNDSKFPGDRSLVFDEDIVDELVDQNRPAVNRSSEE